MNLRRRVSIILYIVSTAISVFIFTAVLSRVAVLPTNTSYTYGVVRFEDIYYAQNRMAQGLVFKMDETGAVSRMFTSRSAGERQVRGLSADDEDGQTALCVVLSSGEVVKDDVGRDKTVTKYRIVGLDESLGVVSQTARFELSEDEVLTGFSAEPMGLFLTTVRRDGMQVRVYSLPREDLVVPGTEQAHDLKPEIVRSRTAEEARFFAQARYSYGNLEIRTDKDAPAGSFAEDARVTGAVARMRLGVGHYILLYREYFLRYIAALLAWYVVLFLLIRMLVDRNRLIYSLAVAELVLVVIVGVGVWSLFSQSMNARQMEHSRFALLSLQSLADEAGITEYVDYASANYFDSERYGEIRRAMGKFVRREGNDQVFYDVLVLRLSDTTVVTSASGRNLESAVYRFGPTLQDLSDRLYRGARYAAEDMTIDDQRYTAIGMPDTDSVANYALVGIINDSSVDSNVWVDNRATLLLFVLLFALGSAVLVLIWYLQTSDLRRFEEALKDVALGRSLKERPLFAGLDMKEMWDSLSEVHRLVDEVNYSKIKVLEAYYRFAPKNIERVMEKSSIVEVRSGDKRDLYGTLAIARIEAGVGVPPAMAMEEVVGRIGEWQKDHVSILAGMAPDLEMIEILFLDDEKNKETVQFLTSVVCDHLQKGQFKPISVFVLYDPCTFGVIGSGEETLTWHTSEHHQLLKSFSAFFGKLGLGLVVSEFVKIREDVGGPLRYIGYILPEGENDKIRLYEVLDAYPARERAERLSTLQQFDEALQLFYERDFYLARSRFSDILRLTPGDALVKWYLFESDRYLNEETDEKRFGSLHL